MTDSTNSQPEDTFKILVATDIHLGYAEKNAIRGQDSFVTFEEILQIASKNTVDFLLLGGDLFHDSRPSPYCINKCLELLRRYCLGDNPVQIEFLSDQSYHFQTQRNPIVNYEDPNLNISVPVFSIHGNHDDPTGNKQISVLDVIASSGLINYFGRFNDYNKVDIKPILLKKGQSKLAIYGLSHIKDERLGRLFRDKKVLMKRPEGDDWFNILVLHQNRAARGTKNYIPETSIPSFIDLVIWGHEHDCRIAPEEIEKGIYISQPGSSVATSLAVGESIKKHVGLLQVHMQGFKMIPVPLKTVRPFVIDEFFLESPTSENYLLEKPSEQAIEMVKEKVDEMIDEINSQHKDKSKAAPLPLIRLKVFYQNDRQIFNPIRIGMHFLGRVANPDDMIKLISAVARAKRTNANLELDEEELRQFEDVNTWATCVEDIIVKYLNTDEGTKGMTILSVKGLVDSVSRYVKYDDVEVLPGLVDKQLKKTVDLIIKMDPAPEIDQIVEKIEELRDERLRECGEIGVENHEYNNINDIINAKPANKKNTNGDDIFQISSDEEQPSTSKAKAKKSTPSRGRGSRGGRGRGRGKRGKSAELTTIDGFFD
ncbi:hypothetical protein RI129_009880 [Pyrocoelia pectoralis]|uniref:Double-strand break repair protein n=1 Tax=Pyrocoelia pectoralis TaxID=417401 RepID=A0AAN7ZJB1_9COLE